MAECEPKRLPLLMGDVVYDGRLVLESALYRHALDIPTTEINVPMGSLGRGQL